MKITVVGTGYVGLVSGACLAEVGNDVLCLDVDPAKIKLLEDGGIPIYEPGLQEMVNRNVAAGRLHFTADVERAAHFGTIQFIAVGTPPNEDPRIGYDFLYAGAGYGGSCFPKDVRALIKTAADEAGIDLKVLAAVEAANDAQKHVLGTKIKARFGGDLKGKHFALWGLAFKANTDDMREATSREVIKDLLAAGATVCAYDPVAMSEAKHCFPNEPGLRYAENQTAALDHADALVIVTEWKEFRSPDFDAIKAKLKFPVIFDGRNLYEPKVVRGLGFEYFAIGR